MKLVIGFITYGELTAKYLPYFLPSLKEQTDKNFVITVVDNTEKQNNTNQRFLRQNYPEIEIRWPGRNLGFAAANNMIIRRAVELGAEYVLLLNPDMVLGKTAVEELIGEIDKDENLGSAAPKIYIWNFESRQKTDIFDSCGIRQISPLRFAETGRGEPDRGQYDATGIIGPTGAAAIYRLSAMEKVKEGNQYFDELMFMYEEDCDLALRLKLAGYASRLVSAAHIWHDRTASGQGTGNLAVILNRKSKSRQIRRWGFRHKHIIFIKYWQTLNLLEEFSVLWFALRMFVFVLFFEPFLLDEYFAISKIRKKIKRYKKTGIEN